MSGWADDEPELDYGDDPVDPNDESEIEVAFQLKRSGPLPNATTPEEWERVRQALIAHRISKGRNPDGTKADKVGFDAGGEVTIVEMGREIEPAELPARTKVKSLVARAQSAGWRVHVGRSKTHRGPVLYVGDSGDEGDAGHSVGDVRWVAEDREHYRVVGYMDAAGAVAFQLSYIRRHKEGKDAPESMVFEIGRMRDPIDGTLDIFPGPTIDSWSPEANRSIVMSLSEFEDWFDALIPPAKERAPRKTKAEKNEAALLDGGEWSG